ncbi:SDR family NAD(P)-dependent oxidoreductase [uncultured Williamsia sp.]|uniref:SDR family NAD(P)-dependent oxidoreductase n=1 Tax=uncultured Williamsia sp. TaxID=259311 RepID=UPI00262D03C9|nr:SDR family NAD(P)-dependent oxidoreductase [uncultured Williamsia sp.]
MTAQRWTEQDVPTQAGKVAVVTGSNTGLGFDTARVLADRGAHVVLAVRDPAKGEDAVERIRSTVPDADVSVQQLDLGSLESVRKAADELRGRHPRIDLLINNAGVMIPPKEITPDGFELQFGTNHLGHFVLTGLLLETLTGTAGSRVVVVASLGHKLRGDIHFDDLNWSKSYSRSRAYAQSKLANLMFCYALQRRLEAAGAPTIAVAAHPGFTDSDLMRHVWPIARPLMRVTGPIVGQDPSVGALPQLRAATDPEVHGGQYWGPDGFLEMRGKPVLVSSNKRSHDVEVQERLWTVSEEMTGVTFPI